jgi:hypothetical protein
LSNIAKPGPQNQPTKTPTVEGDKYTVLLLDEEQLDRFLGRPRFKSLTSHLQRTVDVWPRGHRARIWSAAAAVVLLAVAVVWLRAANDPKVTPAPHAPSRRILNGPPLATGASFSVDVTSFSKDADARVMAGRLIKAGLPSFAWRLNGSSRDVLVGPFVSVDEAETAQRDIARLGFPRGRLHVDERLRVTDGVTAGDAKASPAVVLVAAPGRLAVAFELAEEPQEVSGRRIDPTTFAVTTSAGPAIDAQEWNAPSDVQLVKHVSVAADPRGLQGLQAFVTVAENSVATVRLQTSIPPPRRRFKRASPRRLLRHRLVLPIRRRKRLRRRQPQHPCRLRRRGRRRLLRPRGRGRAALIRLFIVRRLVPSSRGSRRFSRSCVRPSPRRHRKCSLRSTARLASWS